MLENHSHVHINIKIVISSILLGIILSFFLNDLLIEISGYVVQLIMNILKFVSLPILFLSLTSTITKLDNRDIFKKIFSKTLQYTLLTTIIAAIIAMIIYFIVSPVSEVKISSSEQIIIQKNDLMKYILGFIPDNIVKIFVENNVIAIVVSALLIGLSALGIENKKREIIHNFFDSIFSLFIYMAIKIISLLPYLLWAFVILLVNDINKGFAVKSIFYYIIVVLASNVVQAGITLPIFLKIKKISPLETFKGMYPALVTAFFSKSSSATLPATLHCAEHNLKLSSKISSITIPLCTTINMNACAAFIYTTVIFVSESNGINFVLTDYLIWIVIATFAAIGNAGVPMGCYFMASAFLTNMNVPIYLMGIILPFYTILDMLETSINVWSDACVARVVDKEISHDELA